MGGFLKPKGIGTRRDLKDAMVGNKPKSLRFSSSSAALLRSISRQFRADEFESLKT